MVREMFRKNLKRLRKREGLTQAELSEAINYESSYMGKIERGDKDPSMETIIRLAERFQVPVREFFEDVSQRSAFELIERHTNVVLWTSKPGLDEITYVSPNFQRLTGYSPERWSNHPDRLLEIVHPEDREQVKSVWQYQDKSYSIAYRILTAEGTIKRIQEVGSPVYNNGDVEYLAGIAYDLDHIKSYEQTQQTQVTRETNLPTLYRVLLQELFDSMQHLAVLLNESGEVEEFTPPLLNKLGMTREKVLNRSLDEVFSEVMTTPSDWLVNLISQFEQNTLELRDRLELDFAGGEPEEYSVIVGIISSPEDFFLLIELHPLEDR